MIKHIVFFKLKDLPGKQDHILELKKKLEDLTTHIPEIKLLEVGVNFSDRPVAFDLSLLTIFDSVADMDTYRDHPDHLKVVDFLKEINDHVAVVDYEV